MTTISQQGKGVRSLIPTKDQLLTQDDLANFKDEMLVSARPTTSFLPQLIS